MSILNYKCRNYEEYVKALPPRDAHLQGDQQKRCRNAKTKPIIYNTHASRLSSYHVFVVE